MKGHEWNVDERLLMASSGLNASVLSVEYQCIHQKTLLRSIGILWQSLSCLHKSVNSLISRSQLASFGWGKSDIMCKIMQEHTHTTHIHARTHACTHAHILTQNDVMHDNFFVVLQWFQLLRIYFITESLLLYVQLFCISVFILEILPKKS